MGVDEVDDEVVLELDYVIICLVHCLSDTTETCISFKQARRDALMDSDI